VAVRAAAEEKVEEVQLGRQAAAPVSDNWVPVCRPEDLPKGVRKEFDVEGRQVLMFWYRNEIYAIEARSPSEGAYSEGFIRAKFTQDFAIECPATGSTFSLKDGSIVDWYPNNPVLRALTPSNTCRTMDVYPIKLTQDALYVDVSGKPIRSYSQYADRGGAGTSLENNNVFTVQPNVYFEGMDPNTDTASVYADESTMKAEALNPATVTVGIVALGIVAVAGSATAIYYESVLGLAAFWVFLGGLVGIVGFNYVNSKQFQDLKDRP
jgi:nitrite reductase/ring-hydroxylating ferredoxin subunit